MDNVCFKDRPRDLWEEIDTVDRAKHKRVRKARQLARAVQSRGPWTLRLSGVLWSQEELSQMGGAEQ